MTSPSLTVFNDKKNIDVNFFLLVLCNIDFNPIWLSDLPFADCGCYITYAVRSDANLSLAMQIVP